MVDENENVAASEQTDENVATAKTGSNLPFIVMLAALTIYFGFQKQFRNPGWVYIAGSRSLKLIKLGNSIDFDRRADQLRKQRWGGVSDWKRLYAIEVRTRGHVETRAKNLLLTSLSFQE